MKNKARKLVIHAFAGHMDKSNQPYVEHLFRVMDQVKVYADDSHSLEVFETVALLHDLLEDCPEWTSELLRGYFPEQGIVEAVEILTKVPGQAYEDYIQQIKEHPVARAV